MPYDMIGLKHDSSADFVGFQWFKCNKINALYSIKDSTNFLGRVWLASCSMKGTTKEARKKKK